MVCVCVYMCVCVCVCACVCVCVKMWYSLCVKWFSLHIHLYYKWHVYMYTCTCIHGCTYTCTCVHMHTCTLVDLPYWTQCPITIHIHVHAVDYDMSATNLEALSTGHVLSSRCSVCKGIRMCSSIWTVIITVQLNLTNIAYVPIYCSLMKEGPLMSSFASVCCYTVNCIVVYISINV